MGALYSVGNALVAVNEMQARSAAGDLVALMDENSGGVAFSTGTVTTEDVQEMLDHPAIKFTPIGIGKPFGIELLTIYTGDAPSRSVFDRVLGRGKPDMLVVSGVKSAVVSEVAPRAINQIVENIEDRRMYRFSAMRFGSPIVYYSPAMTDLTAYSSVELIADKFSGDLFDHLQTLAAHAAGLPVFAPAAGALLAGSMIAGIARDLAGALVDRSPFMSADEDIRFGSGGLPSEIARFVVYANDADMRELETCKVAVTPDARVYLADRQTGEEYGGNAPYVIATFDGAERPALESFVPQHASAALLERFYGDRGSKDAAVAEVLQKAMTLYNDFSYWKKAEETSRDADALDPGNPEKERLEKLRDAYLENIISREFREMQPA